jgi:predicted ATPase
VCVVDLSTLADPGLVAGAIASALGVREDPARELLVTVADALKADRRLLLLDGCEHVVEESARAAGLFVPRCPDLHLVATSREPLGVPGEVRWPLQNLSVGDAANLFAERARLVQPSFALTEATRPAIEELVRKLDCIPLAIELAAARVNVLTVAQMLARLDDRFRLLAGGPRGSVGRHQTLRAALGWSHDLLNQAERELFRRLSVYPGGFDIVSATAVAAAEGQDEFAVIDDVGRLVDKSLIAGEAGSGRHRMLESIRAYAREKLVEAGEVETYAARHATHFLAMAESTDRSNVTELAAEIDNFRAAQEWFDGRDPEVALRLATALAWLWTAIGQSGEGRSKLEAALARWPHQDRLRAAACFEAGWFAWWRGLSQVSSERFTEAETIARAIGDPLIEGRALAGHATLVSDIGRDNERDMAWVADALRRSIELLRTAGDRQGEAGALHGLGAVAVFQGNHDEGIAQLDRSIAIRREIGDTEGLIYSFYWKAIDATITGELVAAFSYALESLGFIRERSTSPITGAWLELVAEIAARGGDMERAVTLYEVADREQTVAGINRWNPVPGWAAWRSDALARLGEARHGAAVARGRSMSLDAALELARQPPAGAESRDGGRADAPA